MLCTGLFRIHKLARVNALSYAMPETFDLAFKLRRKAFVIEKLHLPPDLSEDVSRDLGANKASLCQPSPSRAPPLDF